MLKVRKASPSDARNAWTARGVNELPVLRMQKELAVAGILQLPGLPLALALCAGRGDEKPVGKRDRGEQRQDAFEQLPTGSHGCPNPPCKRLFGAPFASGCFYRVRAKKGCAY